MNRIGITAKHRNADRSAQFFKKIYEFLLKSGKEIYIEKHVAECIGLKKFNEYVRGKTETDMLLVFGGDGTILSVIRSLAKCDTKIFGINTGNLGFMSEIPPSQTVVALKKIFKGEFSIDKRLMLSVEVTRGTKKLHTLHALNEAVISQGSLARIIELPTKVNGKKLTTYSADGLIVATPTGSTAYSLSAGGPIVYPTLKTIIITPICPHSFTQKPIIIPDDKKVEIEVHSDNNTVHLTIDGQESVPLKDKDIVTITRDGEAHFVRLPDESFFKTLREKLDWGKAF